MGGSTRLNKEDHAINDDSLSISGLIAKLQRPSDIFTRLHLLVVLLLIPFSRISVSFLRHRASSVLPSDSNDKRRPREAVGSYKARLNNSRHST